VLKTPPADLTVLAKRNDGVFPIAAVNEIIDGRMLIAAHGNREMPALTSWVEVAFGDCRLPKSHTGEMSTVALGITDRHSV
jgi:hypothetical protein